MKRTLLQQSKKYIILFLTLFISNFIFSQTITFSRPSGTNNLNLGTDVRDGEEGSTDITGVTFAISSTTGSNVFLVFDDLLYDAVGISNVSEGLGVPNNTGIQIATTDNSTFSFDGFTFSEIEADGVALNLEGFMGATSTGSVTLNPSVGAETLFGTTDLSNAIFGMVNRVVITAVSTDTPMRTSYNGLFNSFVINSAPPANTAPTQNTNAGSNLNEGTTDVITQAELEYTDAEETASSVTYTLDIDVTNGQLFVDGNGNNINDNATEQIDLGETFTQADINAGNLQYVHNGGETTSDSFRADISDGAGGTVDDVTFNFGITPVNDEPSTYIVISSNSTFTEGGSAVSVLNTTLVNTVEGNNVLGTVFTISNVQDGTTPGQDERIGINGGNFALNNGNSGTINGGPFGNIDYSVSLVGTTATVILDNFSLTIGEANFHGLMNAMTYENVSTPVTGGTRTFTFTTLQDDGGTTPGDDTNDTFTATADVVVEAAPIVLTITGLTADNKVYDGTTVATTTGTATLSGVQGGDDVTLSGSSTFTFASTNVGTGITITTMGYTLSGAEAGNYTLTQPTLSADITGRTLTITGISGDDKVYDGTTVGSASGVASLSGIIGADIVALGGAPSFTFASANVGIGITVNSSGFTISGTDSGNYTLTQPTLSADIIGAELTIVGLTGDDKMYDGTTATTATGTAILSGIIGADDVVLGGAPVFTFASPNGGTGITITTTGYTISGTDSGNYSLTQPTLSADITGQTVAITSTEVGPTGASPIPVTITFSGAVTGFVEGDVTVSNGTTSNFSGSGAVYTVDIIPTSAGVVTVDVNANVAMDAGMTGNVAAPQFSITYDNLLGIDDELLAKGVRLYPIPAANSITINTDTSLRIEKVEIFDIRGKMIISNKLNSNTSTNTIDISSMESGVYLMTVYSENGFTTKRIIKE